MNPSLPMTNTSVTPCDQIQNNHSIEQMGSPPIENLEYQQHHNVSNSNANNCNTSTNNNESHDFIDIGSPLRSQMPGNNDENSSMWSDFNWTIPEVTNFNRDPFDIQSSFVFIRTYICIPSIMIQFIIILLCSYCSRCTMYARSNGISSR